MKGKYLSMLFSYLISLFSAESQIKVYQDSIVVNPFENYTNDYVYWNHRQYDCSNTPLNEFAGYSSIYLPMTKICIISGEEVHEKSYRAIWTIKDDHLYLCGIIIECDDNTNIKIEDYIDFFSKNSDLDLFQIKMNQVEKLIGKKFQKIFPSGVYRYPLASGHVIPADWFSGILDIRTSLSNIQSIYRPFQQLVFESGRLVSIQNMINFEWEDIIKRNEKQMIKDGPHIFINQKIKSPYLK